MKKPDPICTPATLDAALAHARDGRPDLLLLLIADTMGAEVAHALADLLKHPEQLRAKHRAVFLPYEAEAIRELYERLRKAHPRRSASIIRDEIAHSLGVTDVRDILEKKKTYADNGEPSRKRSPRKRTR